MKNLPVLLALASAGCNSSGAVGTTVTLKGKTIVVEWIRSDPDRRYTPITHAKLAEGRGFLIGWNEDRIMHHFARQTDISSDTVSSSGYDVVWTDREGKVLETAALAAGSWPGVTSSVPAFYALFLPEGWAKANSVAAGDTAEISAAIRANPADPLLEIKIGGVPVRVETAVRAGERTRGLMQRRTMSPENGMLFVYRNEAEHGFWMGHCHYGLDIAFFDAKGAFLNVVEMSPYPDPETDPGTRARSKGLAKYVVEVHIGWFRAKGLVDGDGNPKKPITLEIPESSEVRSVE
jgi:hypothetical protein